MMHCGQAVSMGGGGEGCRMKTQRAMAAVATNAAAAIMQKSRNTQLRARSAHKRIGGGVTGGVWQGW